MVVAVEILQAAQVGYKTEQERIIKAIADLRAQLKGRTAPVSSGADAAGTATEPKRERSAAARKRMATAQKKRWAEYHRALKAGT